MTEAQTTARLRDIWAAWNPPPKPHPKLPPCPDPNDPDFYNRALWRSFEICTRCGGGRDHGLKTRILYDEHINRLVEEQYIGRFPFCPECRNKAEWDIIQALEATGKCSVWNRSDEGTPIAVRNYNAGKFPSGNTFIKRTPIR